MSFDINRIVRKNILHLKPYSSARDEFKGEAKVSLDANESPFNRPHNRYPDPMQWAVKDRIAQLKGVNRDQIFLGVGSDEPIDLLYRVFCEPAVDNVVAYDPTYGMYEVSASINNVEYRKVPMTDDFGIDTSAMLAATDANTKLIFICSPNNPTGNRIDDSAILTILRSFNGLVVVDEAYIDFSSHPSYLSQLVNFPNLIILQTFSKAWGSAAIRLGMAFADRQIVQLLSRIKYPYNINALTQKEALRILKHSDEVNQWVQILLEQRQLLVEELSKLPFVKRVYPSDANFLMISVVNANELYSFLMNHGIIVRNRHSVTLCSNCLRITVGTESENQLLLAALRLYADPSAETSLLAVSDSSLVSSPSDRCARVERKTKETDIVIEIDLDGTSAASQIDTGLGFFDHMLDQISKHAGIRLYVRVIGDLHVDEHHTMEDTAIALGEALASALGDKRGIERYGFTLPMDDSLCSVSLDFGGRAWLVWDAEFKREKIGDAPTEMFFHFFKSLSDAAGMNLNIQASGKNEHHKIEGIFKAFARALRMAIRRDLTSNELPSTKGVL